MLHPGRRRLTCGRATLLRESMLGAAGAKAAALHTRAAKKMASCQGVGRRVAQRGRATIGLLGAEGQAWSRWGGAQVGTPPS